MAVLVEGISVIIRADALDERFPGGWEAFRASAPNRTLCADGELVRVGFMSPPDVEAFVCTLSNHDIRYAIEGKARDLVVVDQMGGAMIACDWMEFGHVNLDGNSNRRVAACRRVGSDSRQVVMPEGWSFETSLSASYGFVPIDHIDRSLRLLRHENGVDVYVNDLTGKEVFVGGTSGGED
jgi:hypothetical protein